MAADLVFLESPQGDEIKEVEATAEKLSPFQWRSVCRIPSRSAIH